MIHRKTTETLALIYDEVFTEPFRDYRRAVTRTGDVRIRIDKLEDFFYLQEYPEWFLSLVRSLSVYQNRTALFDFIKQLHTGQSLINVMRQGTHEQRENEGQQILHRLCQDIITWYESSDAEQTYKDKVAPLMPTLRAELELDGYTYFNGKLYASEANVFNEDEEEGILEGLILETGLANKPIMSHVLELSESDYIDQKWDDSINNSRRFLESVLKEIADKYEIGKTGNHLEEGTYERAVKVRIYLTSNNLLTPDEVKAFEHVYGLLSGTGSHPNISFNDQARLARNLALTLAQFILLRYRGYVLGQSKVVSE